MAYAAPRLSAQPIAPQATPLERIEAAPRLPRHYIRCTEDRAIPPEYQAEMATGLEARHDLPCGHSPFFACPDLPRFHSLTGSLT